ncbi:hypothetical protein [Paenirhodobacter enshiensis]|uniref:Uncharacterized protein n=1 Tax=Paenirhodobacter enshiensis TaxID=1105367 RepID=A0A086Y1L7_9RHOB|nr:hypothetical protein [Paenirhodobacter enshiensis]KFI28167.1 hypothetical protein CG50_14855 [Paenirhodobacter enshiensis]
MNRRTFLTAAPAAGLIGLSAPALARPVLTFEEKAEEIAETLRLHFRPILPEGVERYAITITDAPGVPVAPHECRMVGYAGALNWLPTGGGWH